MCYAETRKRLGMCYLIIVFNLQILYRFLRLFQKLLAYKESIVVSFV